MWPFLFRKNLMIVPNSTDSSPFNIPAEKAASFLRVAGAALGGKFYAMLMLNYFFPENFKSLFSKKVEIYHTVELTEQQNNSIKNIIKRQGKTSFFKKPFDISLSALSLPVIGGIAAAIFLSVPISMVSALIILCAASSYALARARGWAAPFFTAGAAYLLVNLEATGMFNTLQINEKMTVSALAIIIAAELLNFLQGKILKRDCARLGGFFPQITMK